MIKLSKFPERVYDLEFERDILPAEEKLIKDYGFVKEEINFIMRYKPSFILFEQDSPNDGGLKALVKFFVDKRNFDLDVVRTLALKYPYILNKNEKDYEQFFDLMQRHGLSEDETIKALIECPKLIQKNLEKQMKEIFFLFNLYHGIKEQEVIDIFRSFPYLFCCELSKFQKFMGEFKKYRFQKETIIKIVIIACLLNNNSAKRAVEY